MLNIKCIVNGYLNENCYIVEKDNHALIIDPGSDGIKIIDYIESLNLQVDGILITHYHFDHVGALQSIENKYKDTIKIDYNSPNNNEIGCFKFKKINNFGHTMDSCSFLFYDENIMFTGDFVFNESIGKYDFENEKEMISSLKRFVKLNDDIVIYPGHGPSSTVGHEKKYNYFLRGI